MSTSIAWQGTIISVQPRIRLLRSFDQRSHSYLGYILTLDGIVEDETKEFTVAIGKAAQQKHQFQVGLKISGKSHSVLNNKTEIAEFYKTSGLKVINSTIELESRPPPHIGIPLELTTYRERGHRRLSSKTYHSRCKSCIYGCNMPVEITIDQWNPQKKKFRTETFCYGPKNCSLYSPGPTRKVPGRRCMTWEEEDWVDEDATKHRADN